MLTKYYQYWLIHSEWKQNFPLFIWIIHRDLLQINLFIWIIEFLLQRSSYWILLCTRGKEKKGYDYYSVDNNNTDDTDNVNSDGNNDNTKYSALVLPYSIDEVYSYLRVCYTAMLYKHVSLRSKPCNGNDNTTTHCKYCQKKWRQTSADKSVSQIMFILYHGHTTPWDKIT